MADYTQQGLYQEGNSLFDDIFAFGDLEVQNINVVGIITAKTFSGVDATSLKDDGGTVKIQATTTGATHSGRAVFNEVELQGKVYDSDGDFGTSGQVLSSDGTDIEWVNAGSLTAGAAAEVGVTAVNTNASHFITFVDSSSGNENIRVDTDLTYNPSTNTLGSTNISSLYVTGSLRLGGQLKDGDNTFGSSGQVLSSDGTDTRWVNAGSLTAGAASEVGITAVNDNASHFLAFLDSSSGNDNIKVDTNLTYNPSTNLLSIGGISFSGTISGGTSVSATNLSGNLTGTIQTASQTNITSVGTLTGLTVDGNLILDSTSNYIHIKGALYDKDGQSGSADQVLVSTGTQVDWKDATTLTASNSQRINITESDTNTAFPITFSEAPGQSGGNSLLSDNQFTYNASSNTVTAGTFSGSGASLTSLNASNLQSGTVADARIPNLNASKITAGTFDVARIPDLSGAKITSGTVAAARIDNLNASKITAGTIADARLSNSSLFVTGMIMMYTGSTAPSGWAICNGQNGTPDLRNRFIVGAGNSYNVGVTGGFDSVSLSESQIPSHTHSFSGSSSHSHGINDPGHTHTMNFNQGNIISSGGAFGLKDSGTANRINTNTTGISVNSQSVTISGNTGGTGGGQAHENRPPYYALMFIMKL
tara:strand:+ start:2450 stop:4396 length:1947 start_codon:yes stop_codon:yes gene_type:complete